MLIPVVGVQNSKINKPIYARKQIMYEEHLNTTL